MRARTALLAFISFLLLLPVHAQSQASSPAEAGKFAGQLWDKLLTKCGDSYYLYLPFQAGVSDHFEQWQYKGVRFYVVRQGLSSRRQSAGVQWEGAAVMSASMFRSRKAKAQAGAAGDKEPKAWDAWREWGDGFVPSNAFLRDMPPGIGDPPNVIRLRKERGKWLFWPRASSSDLADLDEIVRRKPSCADVEDRSAAR